LPFPLAPLVIVTHPSLLVAFQLQFPPADTENVPLVAAAETERLVAEIVTVHDAPACETENELPPIVSVPLRGEVLEFAETLYPTVPSPESLEPDVIFSHVLALEVAVHEQPAGADTATVPVPPEVVKERELLPIVTTHAVPAWLTVKVLPPIEIVPERGVELAFAATVNDTLPGPAPDAEPLIVIQFALLVAVHAQPAAAVTATLPLSPSAFAAFEVGESV
jgi:hypothetical protein